ncbi:unnamed protein product [Effrenium voratum]|nr:unnamed protein product [Effrenium voratum]
MAWRRAIPVLLILVCWKEAFLPQPRVPCRAASQDAASIGIVEPLVSQLPRQERETFLGLLRLLSLPVDDAWFSAVLLVLVRFRMVKRLVMASQHWRRWLTTYTRRLRTQDDRALLADSLDANQVLQKTIRLSGGGWLRQGAKLVQPSYVGDVIELGGFENNALNTEFVLCKTEGLQHGKPVYQSRNKEFMLCSAPSGDGDVWIVSTVDKFQQTKNQASPEGWPLKRLGALLVSPVGAQFLEAPVLNWQESSLNQKADGSFRRMQGL